MYQAATEKFETDVLKEAQRLASTGKGGITLLPGVEKILLALNTATKDAIKWAIVTSGKLVYRLCPIMNLSDQRVCHQCHHHFLSPQDFSSYYRR